MGHRYIPDYEEIRKMPNVRKAYNEHSTYHQPSLMSKPYYPKTYFSN